MKNQGNTLIRQKFENLKTKGGKVSPARLRLESKLTNSNILNFNINPQESGMTPTERRLNVNDTFVFNRIHFGLIEVQDNLPKSWQTARIHTFPNPSGFTAGVGFNVDDLESIFNGIFSLKTGIVDFLPEMSMRPFLQVPAFPEGEVLTSYYMPATLLDKQYNVRRSPWDENSGAVDLPTLITLSGGEDIDMNIKWPTATGLQIEQVGGRSIYAVLQLDGLIVKGGNRKRN